MSEKALEGFEYFWDTVGCAAEHMTKSEAEMVWQAARRSQPEGWISVDERMPEPYTEVMAWPYPTPDCMTAQHHTSGKFAGKWTYSEYTMGWGYEQHEISGITHWMPLPQPPEA